MHACVRTHTHTCMQTGRQARRQTERLGLAVWPTDFFAKIRHGTAGLSRGVACECSRGFAADFLKILSPSKTSAQKSAQNLTCTAGQKSACQNIKITRKPCPETQHQERDRQTDRQTDRPTDGRTDGRTDGQTDKQTNRQAHKQTNRQTDKRTNRQKDKQTNRDRQRQTETDRDRQRQTETDRDRLRQTETD